MKKLLLALSLFVALAGFGQKRSHLDSYYRLPTDSIVSAYLNNGGYSSPYLEVPVQLLSPGLTLPPVTFSDNGILIGSEANNPITYDTTISEKANGEGPFTWQVRVTRQQNDNSLRPVLLSMPGSGETGASTDNLVKYGPHFWLLNGWDGGVKLGNGTHYPIIITVEQPAQNMRPWHLKAVVETLLKTFPIKPGSVHVAGLSQGSYEWGELIGFSAYSGDQTAMSEIKSWVDLEGVGPGDNFLGYDAAYPGVYGTWASKYGGRFFGLEGTQDSRNIWQISQAMNKSVPSSAYFSYENIGGGGHCCWNSMYDPSVTNWINNSNLVPSASPANTPGNYSVDPTTGTNIFQWMLRQGDTSMSAAVLPPVLTIIGLQVLMPPLSSATLSGSASARQGAPSIHSVTWSQVSGPTLATLATPTSWSTTATGLIGGTYVFKMTVTDNGGGVYSMQTSVSLNYANGSISQSFTRGDCACGTATSISYTVPAGKYISLVSQATVDSLAKADLIINGPAYANTNGTCTPVLITTITTVSQVFSDGTTKTTTTTQP